MRPQSILIAALALAAIAPARAAYLVQSNFDENLEGWSVTHDATAPIWNAAAAGADGGCAEASDQGQGAYWYWSAPPKFLGNKSTAVGQTLSFRLWESTGTVSAKTAADVVLVSGDLTAVATMATPIQPGAWTDHTISLIGSTATQPDTPWHLDTLSGPLVTAEQMATILGSLDTLLIRGEYLSTLDTGRLDSVILTLTEEPPATSMPVATDFNKGGDDGWTVIGDAQGASSAPTYKATGGVANTGYVEATDDVQGGVWYWAAPAKYLGNVGLAYGLSLSFALQQSSLSNQFSSPDIILESGETRLVYRFRHHPNTTWTPYTVQLQPGYNWHVGDLNGPTPTGTQFYDTLQFLTALRIRGEFVTGPDTDGLDNVVLGAPKFYYGDMNMDNANWLPDVIWCLKRVAGLEPASPGDIQRGDLWPVSNGDMGDGVLDMRDVLEVALRMS